MHSGQTETNSNEAEVLALNGLAWLASEMPRLEGFMRTTGVGLQTLRDAAGEPALLGSVLDHLLQDEKLLLAWCEAEGHDPAKARQMRQKLPGREVAYW